MNEKNQQIRERAYQLCEEQGRPDGREIDHWIEAEQQLRDSADDERASEPERTKASAKESVRAAGQRETSGLPEARQRLSAARTCIGWRWKTSKAVAAKKMQHSPTRD
jgi:hypothetical protein